MKDCLKQSKESSKSKLNLKSTKESEQKTNKSMGCSTYKSPIVFKEVGVGAKGVRVSAKLATPHHILRQNFVWTVVAKVGPKPENCLLKKC